MLLKEATEEKKTKPVVSRVGHVPCERNDRLDARPHQRDATLGGLIAACLRLGMVGKRPKVENTGRDHIETAGALIGLIVMSKQIKEWNIKTRLRSVQQSWNTKPVPGFDEDPESTSVTITGWDSDISTLAKSYKKTRVDWENNTMQRYDVSINTGDPLSTLTVTTHNGRLIISDEDEWSEPKPPDYGFYMLGDTSQDQSELVKIHEPWVPSTTDGIGLFRYCSWLWRWEFPLSEVTNATYMFANTYMREFRDNSQFGTSLRNLNNADGMFTGCFLDLESVRIISTQIKKHTDGGSHKIALGVNKVLRGDAVFDGYLQTMREKGWTLTVTYNTYYVA